MRALVFFASAILAASLHHASAAPLRLGEEGIEVDAGSLGGFTLHYPTLLDAQQKPVHKLASKRASGSSAELHGQSTREEWPEKVKSLEELAADVPAEKAYYDGLHPPAFDVFGGLPGSREKMGQKASGFFHVEKKEARWFLVDPAGNAFFHLGLCSANPNEDYTLVKGRESAYAWLPPRVGEFASAYKSDSGGTVVSFHLANMIRKYRQPFDIESYTARMIPRMRK